MGAWAARTFDMRESRRFAMRISVRALFAWMIVCVAVFIAQRPLATMFLPFFEVIVSLLQQDFAASLRLVRDGGHEVIQMTPFLLHPLPLTDEIVLRPFVALPPLSVSVDHALVPLVLLVAGVAGWPLAGSREAAVRVLLTIATLPLVLALGTPVLLVGRQQIVFVEAALRQGAAFHEPGLVTLMIFMESGGRWLLPLAAAVACIAVSLRLCSEPASGLPPNGEAAASNAADLAFPPL